MNVREHVILLAGGIGGAKLAVGLASVLPPSALTIIVNTADDFGHWGLNVSPDLDTVMYNLAGIANPQTGWGLSGDTFQALTMMSRYGGSDWFKLGDQDLATSLLRSEMLHEGRSLTQVTRELSSKLGIVQSILPMSDQPVRTILDTEQGLMAFQEYFVHARWQPVVRSLRYDGVEQAAPTDEVMNAISSASLIIFGPSNPYLSLDPILALRGMRAHVAGSSAARIAISPIIGGQAVKGPAAKLMAELGHKVSSFTVAKHYEDVLNGFILDTQDEGLVCSFESLNIRAIARPILIDTPADKTRLARELLEWAQEQFS